jgi:hypothetical protein
MSAMFFLRVLVSSPAISSCQIDAAGLAQCRGVVASEKGIRQRRLRTRCEREERDEEEGCCHRNRTQPLQDEEEQTTM